MYGRIRCVGTGRGEKSAGIGSVLWRGDPMGKRVVRFCGTVGVSLDIKKVEKGGSWGPMGWEIWE